MPDQPPLLCLDLGNSRLKAQLYKGDEPSAHITLPGVAGRSLWDKEISPLLVEGVEVALCSVAPTRERRLLNWFEARGLRPWRLRGDSTAPFPVAIRDRVTLGADRLANAAAAWAEDVAPALILDAGTAFTVDIRDQEGRYTGGLILPGPDLALEGLARGGERLPLAEGFWPEEPWGNDTGEALAAGVTWGLLAAAEGLVRRLVARLGSRCQVILTGGMALEMAERWQECRVRVELDWTMRGIRALYRTSRVQA